MVEKFTADNELGVAVQTAVKRAATLLAERALQLSITAKGQFLAVSGTISKR